MVYGHFRTGRGGGTYYNPANHPNYVYSNHYPPSNAIYSSNPLLFYTGGGNTNGIFSLLSNGINNAANFVANGVNNIGDIFHGRRR